MESAAVKDSKDNKITNKDDSVTNKDGNSNLEKGEQPTNQKRLDEEHVATVTPDNYNGDPAPLIEESSSNKDGRSGQENW
jgi:hypothetical protein